MYLLEAGGCLERSGKLGAALRKYRGVVQIFDDYEDDQYDFHGYILRRFTVNAYIGCVIPEGTTSERRNSTTTGCLSTNASCASIQHT